MFVLGLVLVCVLVLAVIVCGSGRDGGISVQFGTVGGFDVGVGLCAGVSTGWCWC